MLSRHSWPLLLLAACTSSPPVDSGPTVEDHTDLGQACLGEPEAFATDDPLQVDADTPTPVTVIFSTCSSGSVSWTNPTCTATVDGTQVVVTSSVTTETPRGSIQADCGWIDQDCGTVTLPAGSFSLVYGDGETGFAVPHDGGSVCAENSG